MSVFVKFRHSGVFHRGDFLSIDPGKISEFRITRQRNTCELLAITPENHQSDRPYSIATRDREYQLQEIITDLKALKKENGDLIYEITDTDVHRIKKGYRLFQYGLFFFLRYSRGAPRSFHHLISG